MVRYLMLFSYCGRGFGGFQIQTKMPVKSVAGVINKSINIVNNLINPNGEEQELKLIGSSRTDKGVHALCNAGHIDFKCQSYEHFNPDEFTHLMNSTLSELDESIMVTKTVKVPENFNSRRNSLSRSYLYRLCVMDGQKENAGPHPLFEENACMFIEKPIDMDLVAEAGKLLHGVNDFRAFTLPKVRQELESLPVTKWGPKSVKNMEVKVYRTPHSMNDENVSKYYQGSYQMWNIVFKSSSFLYRQVRRMTGAMLSVGFGDMTLDDIKKLLDESTSFSLNSTPSPSKMSTSTSSQLLSPNLSSISSSASFSHSSPAPSIAKLSPQLELPPIVPAVEYKFKVPSDGLYLINIEYPEEIMAGNAKEFVPAQEKSEL